MGPVHFLRFASVLAIALVGLTGCTVACPTIGYAYVGPAEIHVSDEFPDVTVVEACFGDPCQPALADRVQDRQWQVPQEEPFLSASSEVGAQQQTIRVILKEGERVIIDGVYDIPVRVDRVGIVGQCPGPFSYEPIMVEPLR